MSRQPDDDAFPGFDIWPAEAWYIECDACGEQGAIFAHDGDDATAGWVLAHKVRCAA